MARNWHKKSEKEQSPNYFFRHDRIRKFQGFTKANPSSHREKIKPIIIGLYLHFSSSNYKFESKRLKE